MNVNNLESELQICLKLVQISIRYRQGLTGRVFQLRVGYGSGIGKNISGRFGYGLGTGICII